MLIGYGSGDPEGTQVAAYVATHTERLGLLIAHRPGFVSPTWPRGRSPRSTSSAADGSRCT